MKYSKITVFKTTIALITALGIQSCDRGNGDPFSGFDPYASSELPGRVEAYYDATIDTNSIKSGNVALYIDFSAGMNTAFSNPEIKHLMGDCFNAVLADQFDVYKLVGGTVTPLEVTNPTELGEKVSDAKEYLNRRAPIQMGVEKIIASNSDALLITDFEEFQNDKEVTSTAYLKISFSKWLAKGNSINFFVANYNEGKVTKHIYFTIFSCGIPDAKSLMSKLGPKLALLNSTFELSTRSFKLSTDYPTEKSGGIFYDSKGTSEATRNVLDLKGSYINGLKKGKCFEFYPLGVDWNTIEQLHESYKEENQFNDFFRKLWIDLSNEDSYLFGDFAVNVSDVSDDYEQFSKCLEVKKHKPKLTKGSNGEGKFADDEKDLIAMECYGTDGSLKSEWQYKAKDPMVLTEVFLLNQMLFKNTKTSDRKKTELAVSFDPQFKVKNIQNPVGLLRVDIVLKSAQPNLSNPVLDQFKWVNESGISNVALRESIVSTLQDLKPENEIVYSYYIKTNQ